MTAPHMLKEIVRGPQAWTAAEGKGQTPWIRPLPDRLLSDIKQCAVGLAGAQSIADLQLPDSSRRAWSSFAFAVRDDLETGRGFVILDRVDLSDLSPGEATACYWLIGQLLGEPFAQNVQGTLLYDVRDTGQDVAAGARFSVTNYESSFHSDNSFGDSILDYVGLLCLKTAKAGGVSQNVSAYSAHNVLLTEFPEELQTLYQPMHVDRRGGFREGESPTVLRPIFAWDGSELTVRYLRYWIDVGQEKAGEPLTAAQRRALDVLDAVLARPNLRVEFSLQPGQIYFINNRWILHNRTAFTDYPELERRRHLVRLWLRAATEPAQAA